MFRREAGQSHIHTLGRLADGHPGATIALMELLRCGRSVDTPVSDDAAWCLQKLEALGIRGVALNALWGDVCGCNANQMIQVLRTCDGSGNATRHAIAINHHGQEIDRETIGATRSEGL